MVLHLIIVELIRSEDEEQAAKVSSPMPSSGVSEPLRSTSLVKAGGGSLFAGYWAMPEAVRCYCRRSILN